MDRYTHRYSITADLMDMHYRMTPGAVLLWFQDSFARYMTILHVAAFDLVKQGLMWVVTELRSEFRPVDVFWADEVDVCIWIREVTPLRIYSDFIVRKAATQEEIVRGSGCWSLLDTATHSLAHTDAAASAITVLPEAALPEAPRKSRFPAPGAPMGSVRHHVNLLDLDFNGHVGNRSYLSIAMLTATDGFLSGHRLRSMQLKWLRETPPGETLSCGLYAVEGAEGFYQHILTQSDGTEAARILSQWEPIDRLPDIARDLQREQA